MINTIETNVKKISDRFYKITIIDGAKFTFVLDLEETTLLLKQLSEGIE